MRALRQQKQYEPLAIETVPIPTASEGSAVIEVLVASVISYTREIYNGTRKYQYITPLTAGSSAVGRVKAVGPDATSLKPGQLVLFDITIRSRDDPSHVFLSALAQGFTDGSAKLMRHWTDGAFAEFVKAPLENVFALDEERLMGELGYSVAQLSLVFRMAVPWGGLVDINLRAGETVVIAPATGGFGGAAVHVALAMGARVIAMGRNTKTLGSLEDQVGKVYPSGRLITVPIMGDVEKERAALVKAAGKRGIDAFLDISPPAAINSSHFTAAILALKHSGRVSLMGGQQGGVTIPHFKVMHSNIQLRGKWMYEREDVPALIRLVEAGNLVLGSQAGFAEPKEYRLDEWKEAFDHAYDADDGVGAVLVPGKK